MKYWTIVRAALTRKRVRTFMTVASIATAFLLFSLGRSVAVAFTNEVDYAGKDRLVVSSKLSFTQAMPMAYANRIEAIEGVDQVAWRQWFGGTYIDRSNFFPKWPVPDSYFDVFPEYIISEGGREAFSQNIQGMIAGADLAERYGWKIGDRIPIIGDIWVKSDNSNNWEFDLVGTFTNANGGEQDEASSCSPPFALVNVPTKSNSQLFELSLLTQISPIMGILSPIFHPYLSAKSADLAERYGWKIGDRIPIIGDIWVKSDNSNNWEFDLVGTFTNANGGEQDEASSCSPPFALVNVPTKSNSQLFELSLLTQISPIMGILSPIFHPYLSAKSAPAIIPCIFCEKASLPPSLMMYSGNTSK